MESVYVVKEKEMKYLVVFFQENFGRIPYETIMFICFVCVLAVMF